MSSLSLAQLVFTPTVVGLLGLFLWIELREELLKNIQTPFIQTVDLLIFILGFYLPGLGGVIVMARRELPQLFFTIRGKPAILLGALITIVFWGIAIRLVIIGHVPYLLE